MPRIILFLLSILLITGISAKKTSLKLKTEKARSTAYQAKSAANLAPLTADSLEFAAIAPGISFSGFDKPYNSSSETFLITNSSINHISGLKLRIVYRDPEGRMLHAREELVMMSIPPTETRQTKIKSFDPHHTYYYHKSASPKKQSCQPFFVEIHTLEIYLPR